MRSMTDVSVVPAPVIRKVSIFTSPCTDCQRPPPATCEDCDTSLPGTPRRVPVAASSTMRQPARSCFNLAESASFWRSSGLRMPLLAAVALLEGHGGQDRGVAEIRASDSVVVAGPNEVGLDRHTLGLGHGRIRGACRGCGGRLG